MSEKQEFIDLHIHTTASDSVTSPLEVLTEAHRLNFRAIAIADHDTLDGFMEVKDRASDFNLELIPAVELSAFHQGIDFHFLGYLLDYENPTLLYNLKQFKTEREVRGRKMIEKLNRLGVPLKLETVKQIAKDSPIARPHVADALLQEEYVQTYDEAFARYLGYHAPAYIPKKYLTVKEALDLVHQACGVAVLAHPGITKRDELIGELIRLGLDGIEVYHSRHTAKVSNHYLLMAKKYGLIYTGGSDCHGKRKGKQLLGTVKLPYKILERLRIKKEELFKN